MVARVKKALVLVMLLAGCASAPTSPEQQAAAAGGAAGCLAQGFVAAADTGKGEMIIAGLVLMPFCALLASNAPEGHRVPVMYPAGGWAHGSGRGRGLVARGK
jgi:hypothetical protein